MAEPYTSRRGLQGYFQVVGSLVLTVAALYWAQKVLIPLTLAVLLAFLLSPLVIRLQRSGLGRLPAVILVTALAFSLVGALGGGIPPQVHSLPTETPQHRHEIEEKITQLTGPGSGPLADVAAMVNDIVERIQGDPTEKTVGGEHP